MNFSVIPAIIALFLCVTEAFAQNDGSLSNDEILKILDCVSTSKDDLFCSDYDDCVRLLPRRAEQYYDACQIHVVSFQGKWNCENDELYGNEDNRKKIIECFELNIPEDLNENEQQSKNEFDDCVRRVGDECTEFENEQSS
ncbi:hypothetical protein NPIL_585961 [Nephila pilipes]|uniref:Uncharacterized protein n=1 Tax=Nephila pilipes TaxID=299642 RepID=A0A8X6QXI1_NEPPI|nr:hypothetical protein NPIL_585961 [Nephila pilipes]